MPWLHHPRFVRTRDYILASLQSKEVQFRKTKPVIFLCGGYESRRRDRLAQYLRGNLDALVFYAEDIWAVIVAEPTANALAMEDRLAQLSDIVILVVESPGTFAELGAFSLSPSLRIKLLPILEIRYRGSGSFIETGPVRWVDAQSNFGPSIWVDHNSILDAAGEITARIQPLRDTRATLVDDIAHSEKHQLLFACDLVAIFGPCPVAHVEYYLDVLIGDGQGANARFLLALAKALQLIDQTPSGRYFRPLDAGVLRTFHRTNHYVSIPDLRAKAVSTLQTMPDGLEALEEMEGR